ncbi:MAG: hypothetical protein ACLFTH_02190 [Candidatus Woesearchaeota archaeon]
MKDLFGENKTRAVEQKLLKQILKRLDELNKRVEELEISKNNPLRTDFSEKENIKAEETIPEAEEAAETEETPIERKSVEEDAYIILDTPQGKKQREEAIKALQRDAAKEVSKNRKSIVKEKILSQAGSSRCTPHELKKIFVDSHKYCSKATFYRYLTELEEEEKINYISINNKKYIYPLSTTAKEPTTR